MRNRLIGFLILALTLPAFGQQAYPGTPPPAAAYISTNGNIAGPWNPLVFAAGTQAYSGTPGAAALYYSSTGNIKGPWYPCTLALCFGSGSGLVNSGTANQLAYYATTGTAVSGTNAIPNGTTATTQTTGDNSTKVATDAFVLANAGSGSYTNLIGSSSQTSVALINPACSGGTFYATTPLSIATGGTVSCPVQFSSAGLWTIASGQTVTFTYPVTETDAPAQHFAGSGSVVLASQDVPIEWFGGVGDGNFGANTGTDNTTASANALASMTSGRMLFQCGQSYRFATTGPAITTSGIGLASTGCFGFNGSAGGETYGGELATIFSSSASATIVSITGPNTSAAINWNSVKGLNIARAVPPGAAAIGIQVHYATGTQVWDNAINDSTICVDTLYAPSSMAGGFERNSCLAGSNGVSQGTGTYIGWNAQGGATGFVTMKGSWNQMAVNLSVITSATTQGFKTTGVNADLEWDYFSTSFVGNPLYLTGTLGQDMKFFRPILDNVLGTNYISIPGNSINIDNWWISLAATTTASGWELNGATGVSLVNGQCYTTKNIPCIYQHASSGQNIISANHFFLGQGGSAAGQAVLTNNSQAVITSNNVDGNQESGYSLPVFQFVGASGSTSSGNSASRGAGSAMFAFDASSDNNCCWNVSNYNSWGTSTDAGTGNSFASGTGISGATSGQALIAGSATTATGSKALAGGGAGLTTGPTSSTTNDLTTFSGSSGQIQDSGVLLTAIPAANIASGSLANGMAATTQTGGDSTTKLATDAFVQAALSSVGAGAGIVTYSGPSLTLTGTQYLPIGGGGLASTTETNVDLDSPAAATIQNFSVQMSAAPGVGNTVVFTWRKNAAGTALTCTITGASQTACNDATHTITVVQGDLMDIQAVTTGTIVGTPTLVMGTQFGIAASSGVSSLAATSPVTVSGATGAVTTACPTCAIGPGSSTANHIAEFSGTDGVTLKDGGAASGGNWVNIGSAVTATGCTMSGSAPYVCTISGTTTAAVSFSSIPGTYLNLKIVELGGSVTGAVEMSETFNSDTTTGHYAELGTQIGHSASLSGIGTGNLAAAWGGGLNTVAAMNTDEIDGYTQSIVKLNIAQGAFYGDAITTGTLTSASQYNPFVSVWNSTSAITAVTLTLSGDHYANGAVFMIYASN